MPLTEYSKTDPAEATSISRPQLMNKKARVPRFGWLLIICFASWIFCGWLVWYVMSSDMSQCCDLTFLEKLTTWFK